MRHGPSGEVAALLVFATFIAIIPAIIGIMRWAEALGASESTMVRVLICLSVVGAMVPVAVTETYRIYWYRRWNRQHSPGNLCPC